MIPLSQIRISEEKIRHYCEGVDFKGWDPWDALASPLFRIRLFNNRFLRWMGNHSVKIAPFNIRPLLGIEQDCFAKGLALFISGYVLRDKLQPDINNLHIINMLKDRLLRKAIPGYSGICWGTNVAYQTRAFYVPPQTPSLVHTAFAVEALLDLYEIQPDDSLIEAALSACDFVLTDLKQYKTEGVLSFSYTPTDTSRVINVTALAARMLVRTGKAACDKKLMNIATPAAAYVAKTQKKDGSWPYGEGSIHAWIDNYHTGFVLECLHDYLILTGDESVKPALIKGLQFYLDNFFLADGTPKFYPTKVHPVDGHCLAQGILTLSKLRKHIPEAMEMATKTAEWGQNHFQDAKGYFYFQKRREWLNKISHIRWVQAWMFLALNRLIFETDMQEQETKNRASRRMHDS